MTDQVEDSFRRAMDLVAARVGNDTDGMAAALDGLDRDQVERLATTLAAAFAQYGVEASGGPDQFVAVLDAMRARF